MYGQRDTSVPRKHHDRAQSAPKRFCRPYYGLLINLLFPWQAKYNTSITGTCCGRCSGQQIIIFEKCVFFINMHILQHLCLKMKIALAIPDSKNE